MLRKGDEPIPGYRLAHFLGRGAFGEVWRASAPGGTSAALKFIDLNGKQGLKEYRAVQRVKEVRHAHLLPIYAFWMLDQYGDVLSDAELEAWDLSGSVMPTQVKPELLHVEARPPATLVVAMLLGDKSLSERLEECRGPNGEPRGIPIDELLDYMEDAAKGIDFLNSPRHDLGDGLVALQHCDIKPQNLLLVGNSVLVCDFGLARVLGDDQRTKTAMAGSPAYMAPEVIRNRKPSGTTDQYALAITYFELRTGKLPFDHESYAAVLDAHLRGKLDWSRLSPAEREIIAKATALEPANRFGSSLEMVRTLRRTIMRDSGLAAVGHAATSSGPTSPTSSHTSSSMTFSGGPPSPVETITHGSEGDATDTRRTPGGTDAGHAADGALADMAARDTALVTQSTVDSTSSDEDEPAPVKEQAAAAASPPSAKPPRDEPVAPAPKKKQPSKPRAIPATGGAPPAGKHPGLSLALWLAVASGLGFAAWKYWPDSSSNTVVIDPDQPSISPKTSDAPKSNGEATPPKEPDTPGGKTNDQPPTKNGDDQPPVAPRKETLRLVFSPADSRVTIDGAAQPLDASGTLSVERLPDDRIAVAAQHDGYRDFAATKTLAEWRAAGAIRLEPLPVDYAAEARDLLAKGRTPQAIAFLEKAIAEGHGSPTVYHALGLARQQLGDDRAAVDAFTKAIATDAKFADAFRFRADSYRKLKKWTEAIADLERFVELVPAKSAEVAEVRVTALVGRVYESLAANRPDSSDSALRDSAQAIALAGDHPAAKANALVARGAVRRKREQLDDAIEDFRGAAKLDADVGGRVKPALAEALFVRGLSRNATAQQAIAASKTPPTSESLKVFDPAIDDLTESITLAPSDDAYSARGFAYNAKQEFAKAITDFNRALAINPRNVLALHNRGFAYNAQKEYEKGIEDLTTAIRLKPNDHPTAYNNRGFAHLQLGHYAEAIDDYTEAIRQSRVEAPMSKTGLAFAFRGLGEKFEKQGDFEKAENLYAKALEHAGAVPTLAEELRRRIAGIALNRATSLASQGRLGEALNIAEQHVLRNPKDADAYATRAYVYFKRRQFKEAIADYDKAISIEPKNPNHHMRRGMVNTVAGNLNAAIIDFTAAIALDGSLAEAYELRAQAYNLRKTPGDEAQAAADKRKADSLKNSFPLAPPAPAP